MRAAEYRILARRRGEATVAAVCPRLELPEAAAAETMIALAPGWYRNVFTAERFEAASPGVPLSVLLRRCPVALLLTSPDRW